ncbi:MAG TPA: hypothetical protein VGB02_20085, partial [Pyrinomonadaceae bacterium]|jgi:hypothetical protein
MIEYTIYCDLCGEMIDIQSGSARQARKKAKAKGLLIRILRKDYCPRCADKLHNEGEIDLNQLDKKMKMLSNSK